jgi:hypothetical protein
MRPIREIEAACARVNADLNLQHHPGYRRAIKGARPNPSRHNRTPRRIGTDPTSGRCGRTALLRKGKRLRLGWLPCNCLSCDDCGPRLRRQRVAAYLELLGSQVLYGKFVPRREWERIRRALGRYQLDYLRFDTPDGDYLVLAATTSRRPDLHVTGGDVVLSKLDDRPGGWVQAGAEPTATTRDLAEFLTSAFDKLPNGGRVTSSRAWALARIDAKPPSGWTLEGISNMAVEEVVEVATGLGLYGAGGYLVNTDDAYRWAMFVAAIGLHTPDHHRWRTAAA